MAGHARTAARSRTGTRLRARRTAQTVLATLDRDWALIHAEYALYALRHPEATRELDEHLGRCETRLAAMLEIALHRLGREPAVPVDTLVDLVLSVYTLSEDAVHHTLTARPRPTSERKLRVRVPGSRSSRSLDSPTRPRPRP